MQTLVFILAVIGTVVVLVVVSQVIGYIGDKLEEWDYFDGRK